jgi:hypothetical protein
MRLELARQPEVSMSSSCSKVSVGGSRRVTACRLAVWAALAVALATGCAGPPGGEPELGTATAALQFAININGLALTKMPLIVRGLPAFDSKTVQQLQLSTGTTYVLLGGNGGFIGYFSVSASGYVMYDAALDNTVFTGLGTNTLGIVAHTVSIDATQLTPQTMLVGGFPGFTSTAVQQYQFPSVTNYAFEIATSGFVGYFSVRADGMVTYEAALNNTVFTGLGTATLGIVPHAVTVDGSGLTPQQLIVAGVTNFPSSPAKTLQLASAVTYVLEIATSGLIGYFNVTPSGTVSYATLDGAVFTGTGTARLTVVPHAITLDATALAQQQLRIAGFPSFDSKTVQHLQLPTAVSYALIAGSGALIGYFNVTAGGQVDFATSYNRVFAGRNTGKLSIVLFSVFAPPAQLALPYNGGEVLATSAPLNIYLVFYGTWSADQVHYFTNLATHVGDSAWYATLTQYKNAAGSFVQPGTRLAGMVFDSYSQGPNIDDGWATRDLQAALGHAFNDLGLPRDGGGIYMMLMSPDVGFTSSAGPDGTYCGYHAASLIGAQKYAALPASYAVRYPGCQWGGATGTFLDTVGSVFLHELAETITDPDAGGASGYYNHNSQPGFDPGENGDLCAWNDGGALLALNGQPGKPYNLKLGDQYYHVQQMLTMSYPSYTGYCSMGAPYSAADNIIGVQSAVYGENCTSTDFADLTTAVGQTCNGQPSCSFTLDPALLSGYSGPAGCAGKLLVQYACWDGPRLLTVAAEASGKTFALQCP